MDSFGQQFAVDRATVLEEMLEKEPIDIAITCTGAVYQPAAAIRIAESGRVKTMLCEKPLSQTAADAEALIAACRNNGVLVAEGWKFRHHPQHLQAKQIIEVGGIGEVMHILSTFYDRFEDRRPNTSRFISSVGAARCAGWDVTTSTMRCGSSVRSRNAYMPPRCRVPRWKMPRPCC